MLKSTNSIVRLSASVCMSALLGLSAFLPVMQNANAQCLPGVGANIGVNSPTPSIMLTHLGQTVQVAHLGDTITVFAVSVSVASGSGGCAVTNGQGWIVYPANNVNKAMQDFNLPSDADGGGSFVCPGGSPSRGTCLPFAQSYTVSFADMNRHLLFSTNNGSIGSTCDVPGRFQEVQFAYSVLGNNLPSGAATACPKQ